MQRFIPTLGKIIFPEADHSQLKLWPLSFTVPQLEQAFRNDYFRQSLNHVRLSVFLAVLAFGIFGITDWYLFPQDITQKLWLLRYAIGCVTFLVLLAFTFSPYFRRYMQLALGFIIVWAGLCILVMIYVAPPPYNNSYYVGIIFTLVFGYTFARARFLTASIAGWLLVIAYELSILFFIELPRSDFLVSSMFLLSINCVGMLIGYTMEHYMRQEFFFRHSLELAQQKVLAANEELESQIRQRTEQLTIANKELQRQVAERTSAEANVQRLLDQQIAINELALTLGKTLDSQTIYGVLYQYVRTFMDAPILFVALYEAKTELLHAAYVSWQGKTLDVSNFPPIPLEPEGHGTQSKVIRTGQPLYIPDYRAAMASTQTEHTIVEDGALADGPPPMDKPEEVTNSALFAPMKVGGKTTGVLQIQSFRLDAYTEQDLALLTALASVAAVAIQNAQLLTQMQQQSQQMAHIIETVPQGMVLLDHQMRIVQANPMGRDYLSLLSTTLLDEPLTHLDKRPIHDYLASPSVGYWHEITITTPTTRIFELTARPVETDVTHQGWVLLLQEVTEERISAQQNQQQEKLAVVGQLAAGIAHDFNNILGVISLYSQLSMQDASLSAESRERMGTVFEQTNRAADLVQQILDFSRQALLERRPLQLIPFLKEIKKMLARTLPENIDLQLTCAAVDLVVNADPSRIQQALLNLAINARDAMPEGGTLTFHLDTIQVTKQRPKRPFSRLTPGDWVRLVVCDTGSGIPADVMPHIFEPFYTTK